MKVTTFKSRCSAACILLLLATGTGFCQNLATANQQTARPINMLVLGGLYPMAIGFLMRQFALLTFINDGNTVRSFFTG